MVSSTARALGALFALPFACSLEGFATGVGGASGTAVSSGVGATGTGASAGAGGCGPCECDPWPETRVSGGNLASLPSLVWAASAWAVTWQDSRDGNSEIYFARLDTGGALVGPELRVTNQPAESLRPIMAWTGSEHAIAYEDTRTGISAAYLSSVNAGGTGLVLDQLVWQGTGSPKQPSIAYNGDASSYVLTWDDFRDNALKIHSGAVTSAGVVTGSDQRITDAMGTATRPAMAYGAFEHGVVWQDSRDGNFEIYFARLDAAGLKIGMEARMTTANGDSLEPVVAFGIGGWAAVWTDSRDGNEEVYIAVLSQGGSKTAPELRLTDHPSSARAAWVAWDGTAYAVAWQDARDGATAIYFARVDDAGALSTGPWRISGAGAIAERPSFAWSGTAWGVAWHDKRNGEDAIYFATCTP